MDRNTILAIALCLAVYSTWLAYQSSVREDEETRAMADAARQGELVDASTGDDAAIREGLAPPEGDPAGDVAQRLERTPSEPPPVPVQPSARDAAPWKGVIEGDQYSAELTNRGAGLVRWTLHGYQELEGRKPGPPIELVNLAPGSPAALATPFGDGPYDLSDTYFEVESATAERVVFVAERDGVEVRKTFEFDLEGYGLDLTVDVKNGSSGLVAPDFAILWPGAIREGNDYTEQSLVALHAEDLEREPVNSVGTPGFFGGLFGGNGDEIWRDVHWAGVDLKYFASLILPEAIEGTRASFEPLEPGEAAMTKVRYPPTEMSPGQSARRRYSAFLGPKKPELLESMGRDLPRAIDLGYSWFEPLTRFFQWLLQAVYQVIPNYGWAIILITILVRLLMLPIMNRQMRSMEKMRALQPRMKEIQEKHADDRQKQSEAMMALYKETGVNPLGGCLPMLLQFPVFIGLFFALQSSFDLRQADFMLWINDLSAPDLLFTIPGIDLPFRLLPIVMGGSMILQQKLTPATVDPSQQMMMMVMMPVMMTVLFYQFPSGLVLYWMVSNFLGIGHQLFIGRRMKAQQQPA